MTKTAILQKAKTEPQTAQLSIRMLEAKDGKNIYTLVKESGALDVNSEYAYLLLGEHFKETCAVTEEDDRIVGFVSAYIPPNQPDVLFVWQIAVSNEYQKKGLALAMLKNILERDICDNIKYVNATISPSNKPSRSLFTSLARELETSFHEQTMFTKECFDEQHEEEPLFVVGPIIR